MHRPVRMTQRTCVAIADASVARLFLHERETLIGETRDELLEQGNLVNPARRLTQDDVFTDTRTGSSRMGGQHFGFTDHRDAHLDNMDDAFARAVSAQLEIVAARSGARHVVLCASPHMLGLIRRHLHRLTAVTYDELPKDLAKLTRAELRDQLASYGVLPPIAEPPLRAAQ